MNEIPYDPNRTKEEDVPKLDEAVTKKEKEFCSHDQNLLNLADKTVSCAVCGQTFTFNEIKQRSTPEEYQEFLEKIDPQRIIPIRTEIKGWVLECENTAKQIDPTQRIVITGEIIKRFWDLRPLSDRASILLLKETVEFELYQKGCTNFQWTPKKDEMGEDLTKKLAETTDYTVLIWISGVVVCIGFFLMFIGITFFFLVIPGLLIALFAGIFGSIFYLLQPPYDTVKKHIAQEENTLKEIPRRVAQYKEAWRKSEEEEKAKFKRYFREMNSTKEQEDMDAQFHTWKKVQADKAEAKEKEMLNSTTIEKYKLNGEKSTDTAFYSKAQPFTIVLSDNQNGTIIIETDFVAYVDLVILIVSRNGNVAFCDDRDKDRRELFFLEDSQNRKYDIHYNKGYSKMDIYYYAKLVYRYDFSCMEEDEEFRDAQVIKDFVVKPPNFF